MLSQTFFFCLFLCSVHSTTTGTTGCGQEMGACCTEVEQFTPCSNCGCQFCETRLNGTHLGPGTVCNNSQCPPLVTTGTTGVPLEFCDCITNVTEVAPPQNATSGDDVLCLRYTFNCDPSNFAVEVFSACFDNATVFGCGGAPIVVEFDINDRKCADPGFDTPMKLDLPNGCDVVTVCLNHSDTIIVSPANILVKKRRDCELCPVPFGFACEAQAGPAAANNNNNNNQASTVLIVTISVIGGFLLMACGILFIFCWAPDTGAPDQTRGPAHGQNGPNGSSKYTGNVTHPKLRPAYQ